MKFYIKFYDPYYKIDPTTKHDFVPVQGRTNGGRFTRSSILTGMGDTSFPIDSVWWERYARGVIEKVISLRDRDFADRILSDDDILNFSWRMICEMYETARDALKANKSDEEAIQAAHDYLATKQWETACKEWERMRTNLPPTLIMTAYSEWLKENWDVIPEIAL